ncbi:hypothetical protein [Corynebacterium flavescens]|uniref:Minor tail protein n=1 Tax=Corynebacterium flavescens TaxID=28028 RepID=A0AB73B8M4_CORFL|nr:hypothetical protein [Corynebacterium flavescens]KAA8720459.1 hypothetical protein F4V60_09155 [Corynebacterium flavescens]GEB97782.1 hypothetical protein CFL01nite_12770 [Corynebacterium flavescens]
MADFEGKISGNFADDDDLIRTGRALIELDGFDMLHVPVPTDYREFLDGAAGQVEAVSLDAERAVEAAGAAGGSASAAASSATAADGSARSASSSATAASTAAGTATSAATTATSAAADAKADAGRSKSDREAAEAAAGVAGTAAGTATTQAGKAKQEADRAANMVGTTTWNGDVLSVNGVSSPPLTGPKGQDGTVAFDALTEEQRESLRGEPGKDATAVNIADGSITDAKLASKVTVQPEANAIVKRWGSGHISVPSDPDSADAAASKAYVDTQRDTRTTPSAVSSQIASAITSKADLVGGKVPTSQIPEVALTKPQSVTSRSALLALTAQEGDVGIITTGADKGTYMLGAGESSQWASWVPLASSPGAPVQSVNGQVGTVVLSAADVGAPTTSELTTGLAGKANASHTHTTEQVTGLDSTLASKASTQALSDGLAGKADVSHTHTTEQVTGLDSALAGKASTQALTDGLATRVDGGSAVKKIEVVTAMPYYPVATTLYLVVG